MDFAEALAAFVASLPEDVEGREEILNSYREAMADREKAEEAERDRVASEWKSRVDERNVALEASLEVIQGLKKQNYMDMLRSTDAGSPTGEEDSKLTVESLFDWKE